MRLTVPKGWEVVRYEGEFTLPAASGDDLTALAEAVREVGQVEPLGSPGGRPPTGRSAGPGAQQVGSSPMGNGNGSQVSMTGRRGHLRALPDPLQ